MADKRGPRRTGMGPRGRSKGLALRWNNMTGRLNRQAAPAIPSVARLLKRRDSAWRAICDRGRPIWLFDFPPIPWGGAAKPRRQTLEQAGLSVDALGLASGAPRDPQRESRVPVLRIQTAAGTTCRRVAGLPARRWDHIFSASAPCARNWAWKYRHAAWPPPDAARRRFAGRRPHSSSAYPASAGVTTEMMRSGSLP
jgi:hypothetical protein